MNSPNPRQRSNTLYSGTKTPDIFHSNEYKPRLFDEISILMKANGDGFVQSKEAIILIEKIAIQQLRGILNEVMNIAFKRTGIFVPSQCDFEFLMRRNPSKVSRFRKYMRNVQHLKTENKQGFGLGFLNRIAEDTSDEEQELYDAERTRRLFRADRISQILSAQKYEEFVKARTFASNIKNKTEMLRKLTEILQIPKEVQEHSTNCLEIIIYIFQETIAAIVDFSILTRLNSENHITDPFTISSSITNNMLHLCPEVTQGRGQDGIKAITVTEINEAIRRVQTTSNRRMGTSFRSSENKIPFLAL
jgi:transcription initiation protein SPT3